MENINYSIISKNDMYILFESSKTIMYFNQCEGFVLDIFDYKHVKARYNILRIYTSKSCVYKIGKNIELAYRSENNRRLYFLEVKGVAALRGRQRANNTNIS